jgi:hypothetical protein
LLRSSRQNRTAKLVRLGDKLIAVAAAQVDQAAKIVAVETARAKVAKVVELDPPPLARTV